MKEFIVWDKKQKEFVNKGDYVIDCYDGSVIRIGEGYDGTDGNYTMDEDKDCVAFPYIGKTDDTEEKNKIYAECSIVEFDFIGVSRKGYFKYDNQLLRYIINVNGIFYEYDNDIMKNLKVIGTIQENPEPLEIEK